MVESTATSLTLFPSKVREGQTTGSSPESVNMRVWRLVGDDVDWEPIEAQGRSDPGDRTVGRRLRRLAGLTGGARWGQLGLELLENRKSSLAPAWKYWHRVE